jgi:mono/diheme cytochrome c family protein
MTDEKENVMKALIPLLLAVSAVAQTPAAAPAKVDAAKIFASKCTACHAKDGKGSKPMARMYKLKDPEILNLTATKETDAEMAKTITDGRVKMPSFKGKLKDGEISALIGYIRSLSAAPKAPDAAKPAN